MPFQVKHFAPRERGTRLHSHRVLLSLSVDRAHLEENAAFSSRNISERSFEMMIKRAIVASRNCYRSNVAQSRMDGTVVTPRRGGI